VRRIIIPPLLKGFERALDENDYNGIKGSIYTSLLANVKLIISKNWSFVPKLIELYIRASSIDRLSPTLKSKIRSHIEALAEQEATYTVIDENIVRALKPEDGYTADIAFRHNILEERRNQINKAKSNLATRLVRSPSNSHWSRAKTCIAFIKRAGLRIEDLALPSFIELVFQGSIDVHFELRSTVRCSRTCFII
jgi:proteasome activator subunit 4